MGRESGKVFVNLLDGETNNEIAVADASGAAPVYGKTKVMPAMTAAGIELFFASSGTVAVNVDIENGNDAPVSGESTNSANFGVGHRLNGGTAVGTAGKSVFFPFPPVVSDRFRLKLTGQSGNHASTKLTKALLVIDK